MIQRKPRRIEIHVDELQRKTRGVGHEPERFRTFQMEDGRALVIQSDNLPSAASRRLDSEPAVPATRVKHPLSREVDSLERVFYLYFHQFG